MDEAGEGMFWHSVAACEGGEGGNASWATFTSEQALQAQEGLLGLFSGVISTAKQKSTTLQFFLALSFAEKCVEPLCSTETIQTHKHIWCVCVCVK